MTFTFVQVEVVKQNVNKYHMVRKLIFILTDIFVYVGMNLVLHN